MNITSIVTDYIRKSILTSDFDIPMLKDGVDTAFNFSDVNGGNSFKNSDMLFEYQDSIYGIGGITVNHILSDGLFSPNSFKYDVGDSTAYATYTHDISFYKRSDYITLIAYIKGDVGNSGGCAIGLFGYGDVTNSCYSDEVVSDGEYHILKCVIETPSNLTSMRYSFDCFHHRPSVPGDIFYLGYLGIFNGPIPQNQPTPILPITLRRPGVKVKHEQFNTTTSNYHVDLGFRPSCVICLANQGEGTNESSSIGITDFETTACHYITNDANYQSSILGNFAYCEPDGVNNSVGYIIGVDNTGFIITVEHTGSQYVNMNFLALP